MLKKYKNKRKFTRLFLIAIFIAFIAICLLLVADNISGGKTLSFIHQTKSVLGVQTSREKQEKRIQAAKIAEADKLLSVIPNPIVRIQMEGKLNNDPNKVLTIKSLADVQKIFTLSYVYKITGNIKYSNISRDFLLAWANTYKTTGNSIDETHLQPLFEGYAWVRDSLNSEERTDIDVWLRTIADKEIAIKYKDDRDINNWNSHRINIIGQIGFLINDQRYIDYSINAFKQQVQDNLLSNGSSFDFVTRDALHYHNFDIWALLNFAKTASLHGIDLYTYQSQSGASLEKSVRFLYPYATGEKTHSEFVNSSVAWDTTTGSKKLTAKDAKKWIPKDDLYIFELAYFFDDRALPIVQKIRNNKAEYPSFEVMLAYLQRKEIPISK
jgi:hypothetical protein